MIIDRLGESDGDDRAEQGENIGNDRGGEYRPYKDI